MNVRRKVKTKTSKSNGVEKNFFLIYLEMRDAAQHATADSIASAGATPGADLDGTRMPGTAMRDFLAGTPSAANGVKW